MKPWIAQIQQHVNEWSQRLRNKGLDWWPRFVYHYTDVQNAVNILRSGCLYSRVEARRRGLMVTDNASLAVIAGTEPQHQQFVRLYFRPRTPTQFRNEGIRPVGRRYCPNPDYPPAHCAVPVFFCFDAVEVLSRDNVCFSNGNMGSPHVQYGDTHEFFEAIPFDHVFHQGAFLPDDDSLAFAGQVSFVDIPF